MAFKKDYIPWNKGITGYATSKKGKKYPYHSNVRMARSGEENGMWKGDQVGYTALHKWVKRNLGIALKCNFDSTHKSTRYHWANISGSYLRDINDWTSLCPSCHSQYDKIVKKSAKDIFFRIGKQFSERKVS